jgi:hypothetical protein
MGSKHRAKEKITQKRETRDEILWKTIMWS